MILFSGMPISCAAPLSSDTARIAVFGGIGSIPGAVIGAFIIGICESFIKSSEAIAIFSNAFTFALLIFILLCKPNGLFGEKLTEKV